MRLFFMSFLLNIFVLPNVLWAVPQQYILDKAASNVLFDWTFGERVLTGRMSVQSADIKIDFAALGNSHVNVALDVRSARAGFLFATEAMKGPKVLHAARYPEITFVSSRIRRGAKGALIDGQVTIRGITRPLTLSAEIYRQSGSEKEDLSQLIIVLAGRLNRSDFGANGWKNDVGDELVLRITTHIDQVTN